jgi:hypothetical protein
VLAQADPGPTAGVSALSSEKGRWRESIDTLASQLQLIVGRRAFGGLLHQLHRAVQQGVPGDALINEEFVPFITKKAIPKSVTSNPVSLLVDDATKAQWNNQGLPSPTTCRPKTAPF